MELRDQHDDLTVSVGDANGLDRMVRNLCRQLGIRFVVHTAYWDRLGKRAGHERNGRVIQGCDVLFAFYGDDGATPGTTDCINQARAAGLEVHVYHQHLDRWSS